MLLRRGDIVLTNFTPARDAEANYLRPAVIVSNNHVNAFAPVVMVVPLTSNVAKLYPSDLFLPLHCTGLDRDSKARVELMRHVNVNRIIRPLGLVPPDLMEQLDQRLREHLAL
ncbi:MAG: type II toxin-antitoxin system PemK/MazF family toxin [Truepera sp.]|nr:type II toxin-antitoxin system PemK/MazF family toxin [Truepera sp.]